MCVLASRRVVGILSSEVSKVEIATPVGPESCNGGFDVMTNVYTCMVWGSGHL